jgi:propanol-preferring alcohol dehydrogenase
MSHKIIASAVGNRQNALEALQIASRAKVKVHFVLKAFTDLPRVFQDMLDAGISGRVVLDVDK